MTLSCLPLFLMRVCCFCLLVAMQHGSFKHEKHLHQDAARQIKIMMNTCFVNKMECSITKVEISGLKKEKSLYYVYAQHSVGALLLFSYCIMFPVAALSVSGSMGVISAEYIQHPVILLMQSYVFCFKVTRVSCLFCFKE